MSTSPDMALQGRVLQGGKYQLIELVARGGMASVWSAEMRTLETVVANGSARTNQGKDIDAHQPQAERIAYFATEVRAAKCLAEYARGEGSSDRSQPKFAQRVALRHRRASPRRFPG